MADPLSMVASILQLISAAKSTIDVAIDMATAHKQQRNLSAELENLEPLLKDFEARLKANPSVNGMKQLVKPLGQFEETMKSMKARLQSSKNSKFSKALAWTFWKKKETEEDLSKLERFKVLLNAWLVMDIWDIGQQQQGNHDQMLKTVTATAKGHDDILNEVKDAVLEQRLLINGAEREKIIEWVSPLNFFSRNEDIFRARQNGTGMWLLDDIQFKDWVLSPGGTLWCYGMRAGKTVLSSIITEFLRSQFPNGNIGVACVYLNHKETETQSPENILAGLWRQLIFGKPLTSGSTAHGLYAKHHEKRTRPSLEEMHTVLHSAVGNYSKVYLIIDAFDEYPELWRHNLLKYLAGFQPELNLLLTSRPHVEPETFFPNTPSLEIRATEEDIRHYVEGQIQGSPRLSKHVQSHPELRQEIETKIISKVDGMFLLAKLHLGSILTKHTVKAIRIALQNLPEDLEHTYNDAMDRIEAQSKEDKTIAHLALTWVANAKRPLSVAELLEAIAIEPDTKSLDREGVVEMVLVLSVCAGLVTVDQDGTVRLIHYTTQKYLDGVQASKFPFAQRDIACACLTYLLYNDFSPLPENRWELRELEQDHALLDYSFRHSLIHATGKYEAMLRHLIMEFLGQASRWAEFWDRIKYNKHHASSPWDVFESGPEFHTPLHLAAVFNLQETVENILTQDPHLWDERKGELLYVSSSFSHIDMVELLLEKGVDVNVAGWTYGNALQAASYQGKEAVVRLLIEKGADVNAQGGEYGNALQAASYCGQEEIVQLLIEKGADVNAQGGEYGNALQAASTESNTPVVKLLIEKGADVNAQGGRFGNALQAASYWRHEAIVQLLIEKGADVNAQGGQYGNALQVASYYGHEAIVQLLIEKGADVNAQGREYGNALQVALYYGHEAIVQLLIEKGANVNAQGGEYGNALQAESYWGHEAIVQLLIEKGADVNAQGGVYGNALQAASYRGHEAIVQLLIEKGADVNAQGGVYGNALQAASYRGWEAIVQLLIEKGADVNAQGGQYGNALQAASDQGQEAIVQLLIEKGADVNAQGGAYGNALQAASYCGHEAIVQLLIEKGADVNAQGGKYGNVLQAASYRGHEAIVQLLIEKGAEVNAQGGEYGNALQAASVLGHEAIAQLLIKKGANVNAQGGIYGNVLQAASVYGNEVLVRLLIEKVVDVNAQGGEYGSALQAAAADGNEVIIQLLVENGADLNATGGKYGSALKAAGVNKHNTVVQWLLSHGADACLLEEAPWSEDDDTETESEEPECDTCNIVLTCLLCIIASTAILCTAPTSRSRRSSAGVSSRYARPSPSPGDDADEDDGTPTASLPPPRSALTHRRWTKPKQIWESRPATLLAAIHPRSRYIHTYPVLTPLPRRARAEDVHAGTARPDEHARRATAASSRPRRRTSSRGLQLYAKAVAWS
ncbi:ankyrin repeat-containing domain protein [Mycena rebaudengoi]|nr:ankyrin repeat-containing domain protein [Mycena rebaudengoi]